MSDNIQSKNISKLNIKFVVGIIVAIVVIVAVAVILLKPSNSVVGEWVIISYLVDGEIVPADEIAEVYGEQYQTANSAFSVKFNSDGTANILLPIYEGTETVSRECEYKVSSKWITLSANGEIIKAFEIDGDSLIVYGISNFDGNVILEKK